MWKCWSFFKDPAIGVAGVAGVVGRDFMYEVPEDDSEGDDDASGDSESDYESDDTQDSPYI